MDNQLLPWRRELERIFGKKRADGLRLEVEDGDDTDGNLYQLLLEEERVLEEEREGPCGDCYYCNTGAKKFCISNFGEEDTENVASFELVQMTSCCGINVYTSPEVEIELPLEKELQLRRLMYRMASHLSRKDNYGLVVYTQITKNKHEVEAIKGSGWTTVNKFTSPRTSNTIMVMQRPAVAVRTAI